MTILLEVMLKRFPSEMKKDFLNQQRTQGSQSEGRLDDLGKEEPSKIICYSHCEKGFKHYMDVRTNDFPYSLLRTLEKSSYSGLGILFHGYVTDFEI